MIPRVTRPRPKGTIPENSAADTPLNGGGPVIATDSNTGDILTYTLGGRDASSFNIDSSGQITVGAGTKLDYETKDTYMVTVIATDSFDVSDSVEVIITVTDDNEGPEITVTVTDVDENVAPEFADSEDGARSVAENTATGEDIGKPVAANDANGDALTYGLGGTDVASFDIDTGSGQLMTLAALDYETKGTYSVTVTASDSGGLTASINVNIAVTDANDPGAVTLPSEAPRIGFDFTAELNDPDNVEMSTIMWQWQRENDDGTYSGIPNATSATYVPVEADRDKNLRVTVTYTDAYGEVTLEKTSDMLVSGDRTRDEIRWRSKKPSWPLFYRTG